MKSLTERRFTAGLTLIVVGLGLYALQRWEGLGGSVVLLVMGSIFLAVYLLKRLYGFLIPAGILLGLGVGDALDTTRLDDPTLFGLGCGFLAIYLVGMIVERRGHWWPLIPGTILLLIGFDNSHRVFAFLFENWPLILVLVGILVLLGVIGRGREGEDDPDPEPGESNSAD